MPVDIEKAVREFIADNFMYREGIESLSDSDSLLESGLIDSTGILELVTFLESTFSIRIADQEVLPENLDSLERIVVFVRRKLDVVANAKDEVVTHAR
ncbi:MAG: acyl carrier protein [Planctomycetaceae bacterium]|nr:acyl carrier protein [Planctomycetaceae bacterium]MBV8609734.1 acyl carrier protein [Singulisphaera sp.]MBV8230998.1 acyl carrier protein [Planctomycetaceae bacterium]MBV8268776.1 acyl carrier protein [Planctomycetaceae bacterium]MBV8318123.1 acyl carrier protein [Planctomycetaceae bacterium]